jgi:hypothetical protein
LRNTIAAARVSLEPEAPDKETPMSDTRSQDRLRNRPEDKARELTILRKPQGNSESNTMMAIIMAGIAGLFVVAIIAAYQYASSTPTPRGNPPATASSPATRSAPETIGSGSNLPAERQTPDKSTKQQ